MTKRACRATGEHGGASRIISIAAVLRRRLKPGSAAVLTPKDRWEKGVIMRMLVIRLFYVLVGAALVAGVVISAIDGPESTLVAAETCYGACPSLTALSLSTPTVTYGSEQAVVFRVVVAAGPGSSAAGAGARRA